MTTTPEISEFWLEFCSVNDDVDPRVPYQVWFFGNTPRMAADLAALVLQGKKTATGSLAKVNELRPDEAPVPGGYSIVTDFYGLPLCVVRTTEIRQLRFNEVDAHFAYDEGEGDQTLQYWREVHRSYFTAEAAGLGFDFDEQMAVCCERFELIFPR